MSVDDYSELWRAAAGGRIGLRHAAPSRPGEGRDTAPGALHGVRVLGADRAPARHFGGENFELVRNLFLTPNGAAPRAVVFCAVERGSEYGWIAGQTAELLASQAMGSVCVVDADAGRPSLGTYFGTGNRPGLGEALSGTGRAEDFAKAVEPRGLWVVTAGTLPPAAAAEGTEYRQRLVGRVVELRQSFDYLIVYAPPAHSSPISTYLAPVATGTVLILEPGVTRQKSARQAKERIEAARGRVLGVVLHRPGPLDHGTEQ